MSAQTANAAAGACCEDRPGAGDPARLPHLPPDRRPAVQCLRAAARRHAHALPDHRPDRHRRRRRRPVDGQRAAPRTRSTGRSRSTCASATSSASTRSRKKSFARSTSSWRTRRSPRRWAAAAARAAVRRPPGTGKTHTAKAMAAEAGVPFLFVSGTSFQSMFYGATAGKIRSYFKELRKTALAEGGAIGFIEEIDAIGGTRNGMNMTSLDQIASSVQCCGSLESLPSTFLQTAPGRSSTTPSPRASVASSTSCWCRCSPSTSRWAGRSSGERVSAASTSAARPPPAAPSRSRVAPTSC